MKGPSNSSERTEEPQTLVAFAIHAAQPCRDPTIIARYSSERAEEPRARGDNAFAFAIHADQP